MATTSCDVVILGASSWRVQDISHDRVTVTPAPGVPGKLPFWKGDAVGRPIELGRALGAFVAEIEGDLDRGDIGRAQARERLQEHHDLDDRAVENLLTYLEDERDATGALPTDRRIVVERFKDELGDWRLTLLTPFGGRVHAPWSLAIEARIADRLGFNVQTIWSDDGIAIRLPEGEGSVDGIEELLFPAAEDIEDLVVGQVANSALFASRFRENAARALLIPRRRPGQRTPLWQQRLKAQSLLQATERFGSFPIVLETYRECLQDVLDVPGLVALLESLRRREVSLVEVETPYGSPFASSPKSRRSSARTFCSSCSTLEAPTSVDVILGSRSVHASAIAARGWPRRAAISSRPATLAVVCSESWSAGSVRSRAIREPSGIPSA